MLKKLLKWIPASLATILLLTSVTGCTTTTTITDWETSTVTATDTIEPAPGPATLQFIAASSLSKVLDELNRVYVESKPWITILPNITGGSGVLEGQIKEGMEGDLFLSAAMANMDNLQSASLIVDSSRKTLLNNNLVLITRKDNTLNISNHNDLTSSSIGIIAIADPGLAPVGVYAMDALEQWGVLNDIKANFSYQANTTQVLQAVKNGAADVGIVYMTDTLDEDSIRVVEQAPAEVNAKIKYPVAILRSSTNQAAVQDYIDFLFSAEAAVIFEKYGFAIAAQ